MNAPTAAHPKPAARDSTLPLARTYDTQGTGVSVSAVSAFATEETEAELSGVRPST